MTEQEMEMIKLKLHVEAQSVLIINLWRALIAHNPDLKETLQDKLGLIDEANSDVVFPSMRPEFSNLFADEYQDYLKRMLGTICA